MKKFKKILGMALAVSLIITQIPMGGQSAKAAAGEAVELHYGQKAVVVEEQTAKIDIETLEVNLSCHPGALDLLQPNDKGETQTWVSFNEWVTISFTVTVAGEAKKPIEIKGTSYNQEDHTFSLEGLGIKKGQSFKVEAVTEAYDSVGSEPWIYKLSIVVPTDETPVSEAAELHYGQKAVVVKEQEAKIDIDALEVNLSCHPGALDLLQPNDKGETQTWVSFNEWVTISFTVTVAGEAKKPIEIKGTSYNQEDHTFSLEGLGIKKGQSFKVEAITEAYDSVGSEPWIYKLSVVIPTSSDDSETTPSTSPSDEPSTSPSTSPSEEPSTPPSGDDDTPVVGEVQASNNTTKKLATIIPETTADANYNTAAVTVQCASDVSFNEYASLYIAVTVNGKEYTHTQAGESWSMGVTSTYEIKNEFSIKEGDTYKVEAYTYSWPDADRGESPASSWVFKVSATLGYEASNVNLELGKLYCGKKADVLETSEASAACSSLEFEVKCAADTSFNPWVTIEFTVIINSKARTYTVKGTDESYSLGSTHSCTIDGLNIQAGDLVCVEALTYSWDSASDYVFKVTAKTTEETFTPTGSKMDILPIVDPSKATSAPTTAPTTEPSTEPTDGPAEPTIAPSTEPTDGPAEPTVTPSTEPTDAPALEKGDEITKSGNTYEVSNVSSKTVKSVKVENIKASTVTVPATVKATVNGKSVTYKVTAIAANAFKNATNLKKVTIGSNIKTIGKNAFSGCKKLKTVTIKSTNITKIGNNAFKNVPKTAVIKVPKNKVKAYSKTLKKAGFKGKVKSI